MTSVFVVMTSAWPPIAGIFGRFTPAKNGSVDVCSRHRLPFGTHHFLSPVFMSYAVMPPSSRGLRIETPPIVVGERAPKSGPSDSGSLYPGGGLSAPSLPQLLCGWL